MGLAIRTAVWLYYKKHPELLKDEEIPTRKEVLEFLGQAKCERKEGEVCVLGWNTMAASARKGRT